MHENPLQKRSSGILLHPTSLPGPYAVGDIGPAARRFVDYLARAGQRWWQMLPVVPLGGGDSPYDSPSAFAGSPLLISLEGLVEEGLLSADDLSALPAVHAPHRADYGAAVANREPLLRRAYEAFANGRSPQLGAAYDGFIAHNQSWVWDWALFSALKQATGFRPWFEWDSDLRTRQRWALDQAHGRLHSEVHYRLFLQFVFQHQWQQLRAHAAHQGVHLMGDIPMYVSHDSVDVWANQRMFFLNEQGHRTVVAGVPPDYFSEEGQLWGNPLYRWEIMQRDGYGWWVDRLRRTFERFDAVRLDHFIGFTRYWEVPHDAQSAKQGRYVPAYGEDFFRVAREQLGTLPLVAEDLGIVTDEVTRLRERFTLPGMKVLQFGFCPGAETHLPHRFETNSVVYTGTHDNDTVRGWYDGLAQRAHAAGRPLPQTDADRRQLALAEAAREELTRARDYAGVNENEPEWSFIRLALQSIANTALFPLQDLLGLPTSARMNVPGTASGNWTWRLTADQLDDERAARLRDLCEITERT